MAAAPPASAATADSAAPPTAAATVADCSTPMVASGSSAASSRPRFIVGRRQEEGGVGREEGGEEGGEGGEVVRKEERVVRFGRGRGFSTRFGEEMHCSCLLELLRSRGCRSDLTHPPGRPHSTWGRGGRARGRAPLLSVSQVGPLVIHTTTPPHVPHFSFSPSRPLHIFLSPLLDQRRRRHLPTTPLFAAGARRPPTPAST